MKLSFFFILWQAAHAFRAGTIKKNQPLPFQYTDEGVVKNAFLTLDMNWRWLHNDASQNCFGGSGWDKSICSSEDACLDACRIAGVESAEYLSTYGVSTSGNEVTLRYTTTHTYGKSIGSRLYLLDANNKYVDFAPLGKEISFVVNNAELPCGLNTGIYTINGDLTGNSLAGAAYGTGYGDAQCPTDVRLVNGKPNINQNVGACAGEHDLLEGNSRSAQVSTPHLCTAFDYVKPCTGTSCKGVCDKEGAGWNPYQHNKPSLYGKGSSFSIDTSLPFKIINRFFVNENRELVYTEAAIEQKGKEWSLFNLTDASSAAMKKQFGDTDYYKNFGGTKAFGELLAKPSIMVISLWDDSSPSQMRWLDGVLSSAPGGTRGPCVSEIRSPEALRAAYPNIKAKISDVRIRTLPVIKGSAPAPSPSPAPVPKPVPTPSPVPSPSVPANEASQYKCLQDYVKCITC